mgnify:CR=1 FL=1|jgi:hypothetical protein
MIENIMVLLLYVSGDIMEYKGYENISDCLSTKREIERNVGKHLKSTRYACEMRKVKLDKNADGKYFIVNIVE